VLLVGPLQPSLRKKRTLVALDEGAERYRGWFGSS